MAFAVAVGAAALGSTKPAGAVPIEYVYSGPDLVCDRGQGVCPFGETIAGFTGFTFRADLPSPDYVFEAFGGRDDDQYIVNDNGRRFTIDCFADPAACDAVQPDWLTGDIDRFFNGHRSGSSDGYTVFSAIWRGGALSAYAFDEGANSGCGGGPFYLLTNTDFCFGRSGEGDIYDSFAYFEPESGGWTATPVAPIPVPAPLLLLAAAIAALVGVRRRA